MIVLVWIWRLKFRYLGVLNAFLLALAVVLAINPLVVLQAGFWLSFSAVAILLIGFTGRLAQLKRYGMLIKAQWLISIGLMPVLIVLLLPVSLIGPLANLIAVPWVSIIVVPFALLGTLLLPIPYIGQLFLIVAAYSLKILFYVLGFIASCVSAWIPVALPWWGVISIIIGCLLFLLPRGIPFKRFGSVLCLPLLFSSSEFIPDSRALITVLDVGQGTAILIQTANHNLLYDAGPAFSDFNTGERIIVPLLYRLGIKRLDTVIISHADSDHAGGIASVLKNIDVGLLMSGEPKKISTEKMVMACDKHLSWYWDNVKFSVWQWSKASNGNEASCVLLIESNGERLLLTGDISSKVEKSWLEEHNIKPIHWLLAAHHGSSRSSSGLFLDEIKPFHVIFSRGWLNHFGHPNVKTLLRYKQRRIKIWDTATDGALFIYLGDYVEANKQRDIEQFWRKK